jgi:hypothetical protein
MSRRDTPGAPLLARAAVALYPPAWRARYGQEALALLGDLGGGLPAVASLAWRAVPAWLWPPRHLHDRAGRMRASLATVLVAWAMLAGLGLVFEQLTQQQPVLPQGHAIIGWSYIIFDGAFVLSGLILAAGCLPLWLLMLRRARRQHSARDTVCLLLPVLAPAGFLAGLAIVTGLVPHPGGARPLLFGALILAGFAAAAVAATGPALALRRLRPRGPAVRLAALASAAAIATMLLASVASVIAGAGLSMWAHGFAGYHQAWPIGGYLALVTVAGAVAAVSAGRGGRDGLAGPPRVWTGPAGPASAPGPAAVPLCPRAPARLRMTGWTGDSSASGARA